MRVRIIIVASVLWTSPTQAECIVADTHVTTTPAELRTAEGIRYHSSITSKHGTKLDIILIGDSIAADWPNDELVTAFPGRMVTNWGVPGYKTQNVLWQLSNLPTEPLSPIEVLVVIGTNNLEADDSVCDVVAGMHAISERLASTWPNARVTFVEILPRGKDFSFRDEDRQQINVAMSQLLSSLPRLRSVNADLPITCGRNPKCSHYASDHVHLAHSGYQVLTRLLTSLNY